MSLSGGGYNGLSYTLSSPTWRKRRERGTCVLRIPYPGEKGALEWFEANDPEVYADIQRFYASHDLNEKLEISERLTESTLAPIGGPWRKGELIVFGTDINVKQLQSKGRKLFSELFRTTIGGLESS